MIKLVYPAMIKVQNQSPESTDNLLLWVTKFIKSKVQYPKSIMKLVYPAISKVQYQGPVSKVHYRTRYPAISKVQIKVHNPEFITN